MKRLLALGVVSYGLWTFASTAANAAEPTDIQIAIGVAAAAMPPDPPPLGAVFIGDSPPVQDSSATLVFAEDPSTDQVFRWESSDPILGDIETGFIPATIWQLTGADPERLVFIATFDDVTIYGDVLFEDYNRAVIDVVKGVLRVRYLLIVPDIEMIMVDFSEEEIEFVPEPDEDDQEGFSGDPGGPGGNGGFGGPPVDTTLRTLADPFKLEDLVLDASSAIRIISFTLTSNVSAFSQAFLLTETAAGSNLFIDPTGSQVMSITAEPSGDPEVLETVEVLFISSTFGWFGSRRLFETGVDSNTFESEHPTIAVGMTGLPSDTTIDQMVVTLETDRPGSDEWLPGGGSGTGLYWVDVLDDRIYQAAADGTGQLALLAGLPHPIDIALDPVGGKMYWTDDVANRIQRANLDGSGLENLVTTGLDNPIGIALDTAGGKMYWTDENLNRIRRANLDGTGLEDLVSLPALGSFTGVIGIALDVAAGKMYWTDESTDKIQRANLDGSGLEDLITGLPMPRGIDLDTAAGKMYWVDPAAGTIQRANLDGTGIESLIVGVTDPFGIALDVPNGQMYWSEPGGFIRRANLNGTAIETVLSGLSAPFGLALLSPTVRGPLTETLIETGIDTNEFVGPTVTLRAEFFPEPASGRLAMTATIDAPLLGLQNQVVDAVQDPGVGTISLTTDSLANAGEATFETADIDGFVWGPLIPDSKGVLKDTEPAGLYYQRGGNILPVPGLENKADPDNNVLVMVKKSGEPNVYVMALTKDPGRRYRFYATVNDFDADLTTPYWSDLDPWPKGICESNRAVILAGLQPGDKLFVRLRRTLVEESAIGEGEVFAQVVLVGLDLLEVSFSNDHVIRQDNSDSGDYAAPHWKDNSSPLDGDAEDSGDRRFPVSYKRETTMSVSVKIKVDPVPAGASIKVRGIHIGNLPRSDTAGSRLDIPETTATEAGGVVTLPETLAENPFAKEVDFLNPLRIFWEISLDGGVTWILAGTSENRVYVTLNNPITSPLFETLLDIGCRNADSKSTPSDSVAAIWSDFTDRDVRRKPIDGFNVADGVQMKYWDPADPNNTSICQDLKGMLRVSTGIGSCGAWASLFHEVIRAQGVVGSQRFELKPIYTNDAGTIDPDGAGGAMLVKNWTFGVGTAPAFLAPFTHLFPSEFSSAAGVAGQGNPNPPVGFKNHFVVKFGGKFYDPSYGGNPFATKLAWEAASIDGYFKLARVLVGGVPTDIGIGKKNNAATLEMNFIPR